jgi:AcrR family transcriptional regulator
MRERILNAAERYALHQGVHRLGMVELSRMTGVGRSRLVRHFPDREAVLGALARREVGRLRDRVAKVLATLPHTERRIDILLRHLVAQIRERRVLTELLETDPGLVLRHIRENFDSIRATVRHLAHPLMSEEIEKPGGDSRADDLVDWITRIVISEFLIPDPAPGRGTRELAATLSHLTDE